MRGRFRTRGRSIGTSSAVPLGTLYWDDNTPLRWDDTTFLVWS